VNGPVNGPSSVEDTGYADRVGFQYDVTPNSMFYATYSRGYKGPAYDVFFNMQAVNRPPLSPETSNAYEFGIKASMLDHRLRTDFAWFTTTFDNYQANSVQEINGAPVTNLINAGTVRTQGIEGDITATPIQPLNLNFNFVYDDARVVNFPCPSNAAASCNINGEPLPYAPRWKLHGEGDYRIRRRISSMLIWRRTTTTRPRPSISSPRPPTRSSPPMASGTPRSL